MIACHVLPTYMTRHRVVIIITQSVSTKPCLRERHACKIQPQTNHEKIQHLHLYQYIYIYKSDINYPSRCMIHMHNSKLVQKQNKTKQNIHIYIGRDDDDEIGTQIVAFGRRNI